MNTFEFLTMLEESFEQRLQREKKSESDFYRNYNTFNETVTEIEKWEAAKKLNWYDKFDETNLGNVRLIIDTVYEISEENEYEISLIACGSTTYDMDGDYDDIDFVLESTADKVQIYTDLHEKLGNVFQVSLKTETVQIDGTESDFNQLATCILKPKESGGKTIEIHVGNLGEGYTSKTLLDFFHEQKKPYVALLLDSAHVSAIPEDPS